MPCSSSSSQTGSKKPCHKYCCLSVLVKSSQAMLLTLSLCRVIFYSPQLFISLGKTQHDALIATIVTGVVNHCATYVSLWAADHKGRQDLACSPGLCPSLMKKENGSAGFCGLETHSLGERPTALNGDLYFGLLWWALQYCQNPFCIIFDKAFFWKSSRSHWQWAACWDCHPCTAFSWFSHTSWTSEPVNLFHQCLSAKDVYGSEQAGIIHGGWNPDVYFPLHGSHHPRALWTGVLDCMDSACLHLHLHLCIRLVCFLVCHYRLEQLEKDSP